MSKLRILTAGDAEALEAFLARHADSSVVLRSNARTGGLVDQGAPYQATWAAAFDESRVTAVVAHAWNGNLIFQAPHSLDPIARAAVAASGRPVKGLLGPWAQVAEARERLALTEVPTGLLSTEDLLAVDTDRLVLPEPVAAGRWVCRVAGAEDVPLTARWRRDFLVHALGLPDTEKLLTDCEREVGRLSAERAIYVLRNESGEDVSMSVFTARLPDTVQIGSVWTPVEHRSHGYARGVVAGQLQLARDEGIRRAVLFTGKKHHAAQKAYRAIGFAPVGDYGIVIFKSPAQVG
jgi:hypothetical protein